MPTLKEIIVVYLRSHGCHGLHNKDECDKGCHVDDLFPCSSFIENCKPGYLQPDGSIGSNKSEAMK